MGSINASSQVSHACLSVSKAVSGWHSIGCENAPIVGMGSDRASLLPRSQVGFLPSLCATRIGPFCILIFSENISNLLDW